MVKDKKIFTLKFIKRIHLSMAKILITGGSGMLGNAITEKLLNKGHQVAFLSTRKDYTYKNVEVFYWNLKEEHIEEGAFNGIDTIIHLAGANVAGERWTDERKKVILKSRTKSSDLIMKYLNKIEHQVHTFIGASAIGIYGDRGNEILTEDATKGDDFLAQVCKEWEKSYKTNAAIRKVVFRIGIVLSNDGGALAEMLKTLPLFVGVLGNGKQIYSWIHQNDIVNAFVYAVENKQVEGEFNLVSPNPCSQKEIAKKIAANKNVFAVPAPAFALKIALGEMSQVVLMSQNCSNKRLLNTGFQFSYPTIDAAIDNLLE